MTIVVTQVLDGSAKMKVYRLKVFPNALLMEQHPIRSRCGLLRRPRPQRRADIVPSGHDVAARGLTMHLAGIVARGTALKVQGRGSSRRCMLCDTPGLRWEVFVTHDEADHQGAARVTAKPYA